MVHGHVLGETDVDGGHHGALSSSAGLPGARAHPDGQQQDRDTQRADCGDDSPGEPPHPRFRIISGSASSRRGVPQRGVLVRRWRAPRVCSVPWPGTGVEQVAQIWLPRNSGGDMHQSVDRSPSAIIPVRGPIASCRRTFAVDRLHAQSA